MRLGLNCLKEVALSSREVFESRYLFTMRGFDLHWVIVY
jgi:hypothetical protein